MSHCKTSPMKALSSVPLCVFAAAFALLICVCTSHVLADDESDLARDASWNYPTSQEIKAELDIWISESELDKAIVDQIEDLWSVPESAPVGNDAEANDDSEAESEADGEKDDASTQASENINEQTASERDLSRRDLSNRVIETIRLVAPETNPFIDACYTAHLDVGRFVVPETELLGDAAPAVVRDNLRLLVGGWLADHRLYNEALAELETIELGNVADPGKLLFYTAATHYRLLNREEGLETVGKLLERTGDIPQRYDTVAQLMQADLKALKEDSLDEVARLMDNIQVRLGHGRAGKRVRKEEDDVVEKLDKMIEELEKKQQQQQQQGKDGKGGKKSMRPMQESKAAGGKGPGNVDPKRLAEEIDWGDLPPKEREEALQRLGTEFPSHYREVIEEYFRRLARKEVEAP